MWGLLIWTLVALYRIRATRSPRYGGVTPTWGGGEGGGGGEPTLASRRPPGPGLGRAEPSREFQEPFPSLGALFRGMGRSC